MNCERIQNLLSEYLEGTLSGNDQAGVTDHLRACLPCRTAQDELKETLQLFRSLPPIQAPPELLEGVRSRIALEEAPATPLWKKLFLPAHIKVPLEAAAAVLLFLLVYSAQKEDFPKVFSPPPPPPAARMDAAPAAEKGTATVGRDAEKAGEPVGPVKAKVRKAPTVPPAVAAPEPVSDVHAATREEAASESVPAGRAAPRGEAPPEGITQGSRESGRTTDSRPAAPGARSVFPLVPVARASTAGEMIDPGATAEEPGRDSALPRLSAAPPSILLASIPNGREVTIEVTPENRPGLEYRIAEAASKFGGSAHGLRVIAGTAPEGTADIVRCRVPASAAKRFLDELSKLGTVPNEGQPGGSDLRSGASLDVVAYTVRIRVR